MLTYRQNALIEKSVYNKAVKRKIIFSHNGLLKIVNWEYNYAHFDGNFNKTGTNNKRLNYKNWLVFIYKNITF